MPNAGDQYAALIKEQVEGAQAKQVSFEQRGIAVVTTSGTLASLLFALVAAITSKSTFVLPSFAQVCLVVALSAFLLAAAGGLLVNSPRLRKSVHGVDIPQFRQHLNRQTWAEDEIIGSLAATDVRLEILNEPRIGNAIGAKILVRAFVCAAFAAVVLGLAVADILLSR